MKYIKWYIQAARPYWKQMSVMLLCNLLIAGCAVGYVFVSKKLVDVAVALFKSGGSGRELGVWAAAMIAIVLVRILLNAVRSFAQTTTEVKFKNALRRRLFDSLMHLRNESAVRLHSGDLLNRMLEDVRVVSSAFAVSIPSLIGTVFQLIAALAYLIILDWRLALVIIVVVPGGIAVGKFVTKRIRNLTSDIRKSDASVQSHLQESIQHLSLLQSLEYTDVSTSELDGLQGTLYGNELKRVKFSVTSRMLIGLAMQAGQVITFLWGAFGISTGAITYGMMTAFLQLVGQVQRPIIELSTKLPSLIHSSASIDRLNEIENLPHEEVGDPVLLEGVVGVKLEDVSFAYADSEKDVLEDFSFDFTPGSRTAIVGPTGVGKSTLIRILLSFLNPRKGKVELYVAGQDPIAVSPSTRCNLVYVPQGNSLFSGTIRENLLMGNPEADDSQLESALRTAAADFVFGLPAGLETQCFEAGGGLSEGQAQRIAIARALLRPGSVLLLDEFSSALDAETETNLLERLTTALPDHTMIFITHREKVIEYCNSVIRM
ncbi:MAG: ABC transporter ATP-binding protein [Bacteroidales bacterium]|nr:ABC transporter ATP-binding protein [Bacteroidales bacterium]